MARRPISQGEQAALSFAAVCGVSKPRRSARSAGQRAFDRATEEALKMFQAKDFSGAEARHVVALHGLLHREIIGVEEVELDAEIFLGAVSAAKKLCVDAFSSDVGQLIEYVRWAWAREKGREARRRAEDVTNGGRLSWRWLFAARATLTDYRAAQHRMRTVR